MTMVTGGSRWARYSVDRHVVDDGERLIRGEEIELLSAALNATVTGPGSNPCHSSGWRERIRQHRGQPVRQCGPADQVAETKLMTTSCALVTVTAVGVLSWVVLPVVLGISLIVCGPVSAVTTGAGGCVTVGMTTTFGGFGGSAGWLTVFVAAATRGAVGARWKAE